MDLKTHLAQVAIKTHYARVAIKKNVGINPNEGANLVVREETTRLH
jgi:hypothetical protein